MVLDHFSYYSSVIMNQELQLKKCRMLAIKLMSVEQTNGQAMFFDSENVDDNFKRGEEDKPHASVLNSSTTQNILPPLIFPSQTETPALHISGTSPKQSAIFRDGNAAKALALSGKTKYNGATSDALNYPLFPSSRLKRDIHYSG